MIPSCSNHFYPTIWVLFKNLAIFCKNFWYANSFGFGGCCLSSFAS